MMGKFKIGDTVKIKTKEEGFCRGGTLDFSPGINEKMEEYAGMTTIIKDVCGWYYLEIDKINYSWNEKWLTAAPIRWKDILKL